MLENGDRKEIISFLTDLSIKALNIANSVKEGKFWHAVNKLTGLQQKIIDELAILTNKNENTNNKQVQKDGI